MVSKLGIQGHGELMGPVDHSSSIGACARAWANRIDVRPDPEEAESRQLMLSRDRRTPADI